MMREIENADEKTRSNLIKYLNKCARFAELAKHFGYAIVVPFSLCEKIRGYGNYDILAKMSQGEFEKLVAIPNDPDIWFRKSELMCKQLQQSMSATVNLSRKRVAGTQQEDRVLRPSSTF
jgi:hypothetical protein